MEGFYMNGHPMELDFDQLSAELQSTFGNDLHGSFLRVIIAKDNKGFYVKIGHQIHCLHSDVFKHGVMPHLHPPREANFLINIDAMFGQPVEVYKSHPRQSILTGWWKAIAHQNHGDGYIVTYSNKFGNLLPLSEVVDRFSVRLPLDIASPVASVPIASVPIASASVPIASASVPIASASVPIASAPIEALSVESVLEIPDSFVAPVAPVADYPIFKDADPRSDWFFSVNKINRDVPQENIPLKSWHFQYTKVDPNQESLGMDSFDRLSGLHPFSLSEGKKTQWAIEICGVSKLKSIGFYSNQRGSHLASLKVLLSASRKLEVTGSRVRTSWDCGRKLTVKDILMFGLQKMDTHTVIFFGLNGEWKTCIAVDQSVMGGKNCNIIPVCIGGYCPTEFKLNMVDIAAPAADDNQESDSNTRPFRRIREGAFRSPSRKRDSPSKSIESASSSTAPSAKKRSKNDDCLTWTCTHGRRGNTIEVMYSGDKSTGIITAEATIDGKTKRLSNRSYGELYGQVCLQFAGGKYIKYSNEWLFAKKFDNPDYYSKFL